MAIGTQLLVDGLGAFIGDFGESITYVKGGTSDRAITAVVNRSPGEGLNEINSVIRPLFLVAVANDATSGISAGELDTATDLIEIPRAVGGTAETFSIARKVSEDAGMLVLEVR